MSKKKKNRGNPVADITEIVFIDHIRDLKFLAFVKCAAYKEYHHLVICGQPTDEEKEMAWLKILSQYYAANGSEDMKKYVSNTQWVEYLKARIARVAGNIYAVRVAIEVFGGVTDDITPIIDELKADGYEYAFNIDTIEKDLRMIETAEKHYIIKIKQMQGDNPAAGKNRTPEETEADLLNTLFDINQHEGATYKAGEISVQEYCILVSRLQKHYEYLKTQNHGVS